MQGTIDFFTLIGFNTTDLARNVFIVFDPNNGPAAPINDLIFNVSADQWQTVVIHAMAWAVA